MGFVKPLRAEILIFNTFWRRFETKDGNFLHKLLLPPHCAPAMRPPPPDRLSRVAALDVGQTLHQFLVQKTHLNCSAASGLGKVSFECVAPLLPHPPPSPCGPPGAACTVGWWGGYTGLSAWFQRGLLSLMPWECARCERSGKAKHVNDERCV